MNRAERFSIVMVLVVASIAILAILAGNATVGNADNSSSTNGLLRYRFSDNSVEMIHDFLEDGSHFYEVQQASDPPGEEWSSAGAPTILYDDGTYYLVLRRWAPVRLGYRFEMWEHVADNLLTPWTFVWGENKEEIDPTLVAMDRPVLRKFGGVYYLYFGFTFGECAEWSIAYVSDGTISGIRDKLSNQTQWNVIFSGGMKDPWVTKFGDTYYMGLYSMLYPVGYWIYKSNTPGFETPGGLPINLHKPYTDLYGGDDFNVGPVLYDPSSGKYLYWGTARHGTNIYWFWCSSDDLETWSYAGREMVFDWGHNIYTTARYQDYSLDNGKAVLVMEWDHDKDMASSTFLWEYSGPKFVVENLVISPENVLPGGQVIVSVKVKNTGDTTGSYTVGLKVDGSARDNRTVTLDPGQDNTVTFTLSENAPGTHNVLVDSLTGSFRVLVSEFVVENLVISPENVLPGGQVTVSVKVKNTGGTADNYTVRLRVDGLLRDNRTVTLNPGQSTTVTFTLSENEPGTHTVLVDNLAGSFEVLGSEFVVENLVISPENVLPGGQVTVSVKVTNTGDATGSYTVRLRVDGVVKDNRTVTLNPGQSTTVTFTLSVDEPGTHTVSVDGLAGSFEVLGSEFVVENLVISPDVSTDGQVTVSVKVTNTGDATGSHTVELKIDGSVTDNRTVTLNSGQSTTVTFTLSVDEPGTHTVSVEGLAGSFEVSPPKQSEGNVLLMIGVVILVVAVVVGLLYWRRVK